MRKIMDVHQRLISCRGGKERCARKLHQSLVDGILDSTFCFWGGYVTHVFGSLNAWMEVVSEQ